MFRGEITEFQFYQNRKAEKLIMMPFCQEDLEMHGHNFFELAYITGGTAEHTLENEGLFFCGLRLSPWISEL